jgi:predicted CoA-binding protein
MDPVEEILRDSNTIAVVGMSDDPAKPAHSVPAAMLNAGFRVIPVNPHHEEILGLKVYPRLEDVPDPIDLVNVFRRPQYTPEVARQAVAVGAKALWLQSGILSQEAREIAESAGLQYVEDRCIRTERALYGITKDGRT